MPCDNAFATPCYCNENPYKFIWLSKHVDGQQHQQEQHKEQQQHQLKQHQQEQQQQQ